MQWDDASIDEIKQRAQKLARDGEISGRAMFYLQQGRYPKEAIYEDLKGTRLMEKIEEAKEKSSD